MLIAFSDLYKILDEELPMSSNTFDTDIVATDTGYSLYIELPGVRKENISIVLRDGTLSITADKRDPESGSRKSQASRYFGSIKKSLWLGRDMDPNGVSASMENGVLKIVVTRKEGSGSKKIEIA